MSKVCGIYKITNVVNGKVLIGQSTHVKKRWCQYKSHLRRNKYDNSYLQHAWNKYGECNFKFEILYLCQPEKLDEEEIKSIKEHRSANREFGYNLKEGGGTSGGKGWKCPDSVRQKISKANKGRIVSEEGRKRMSEAHMGSKNHNFGRKFTEETIRKMGERQKGEKSPWFGRHHLEETKRKMREAQTGKTMSEESRRKMSEWQKGSKHRSWGKHHSEETKKKMSEARKGERCHWFGKKFSEETKQKMREARQRYLAKSKSFQSLAQLENTHPLPSNEL